MQSKRNLVVLIVALVAVIAVAAIAYGALAPTVETQQVQSPDGAVSEGGAEANNEEALTMAPDFAMVTPDGEEVALASLQGKPLVLNFWASTCGPCRSEMPEFQSAFEEHGDQIEFAMVNVPDFNGETREAALQLVEQQGYTFPIYFDETVEGQMQYGVTSIPQTFFITPDGKLAAYASGAIDQATLERGLAMLLGEQGA